MEVRYDGGCEGCHTMTALQYYGIPHTAGFVRILIGWFQRQVHGPAEGTADGGEPTDRYWS